MAPLIHRDADAERLCSVASRIAGINLASLWKCPLGEPKTSLTSDVTCPRCLALTDLMADIPSVTETEKTRAALMRIPIHQIANILTGDVRISREYPS